MRTNKRLATVLAVVGMVFTGAIPAVADNDTTPGLPVVVGLGDSWTFGQGAADPATGGYFALSSDVLRTSLDCLPAQSENAADGCKHLQERNIARPAVPGLPGVTTDAVISEQLPVIAPMIADRNGDSNPRNNVEVIYLSAGGNDVSGPVIDACLAGPGDECEDTITERLTHVAGNMHVILGSLRAAAGPETTIVLVTYDSPIEHCVLGQFEGAAELGQFLLYQLDQTYRAVAAAYGVEVATTLGQLGAGDWVGGADCLHPNSSGHQKVAAIAAAAAG
jgi:lysophospholipase L1-like esterase